PVTSRSINHEKYTLVIIDEYSRCPVYIYNHKDRLGKFDEKANDGYLLGYSLVSKAFRIFNNRIQQIKETYHITFDENPDAIKFSKPLVDNLNITKTERYPPNEYLNPYEPSQSVEDTSAQNTILIPLPLPISLMVTPAPQDRSSQNKHIGMVIIIGNLGDGMLTRAMAKQLNVASAHECFFVDFLSKKEPKKVFEALKHPVWVDAMQGEVRGEIGITTFRNALRAQYLSHSNYAKIIWEDLIHKLNKKTREKIIPYLRFISLLLEHMAPKYDKEELTINPTQVFNVHNWILNPNQPKEPPFTDHIKAICNLDVPVDSKAPKYSSPTEKPFKKETKSSSAIDTSPSHPSPPTPVVGEIHKEAQQAASGLPYLGATSEEGAHPRLSSGHDALADFTAKADPSISTPKDSISSKQGMDEGTKNYLFDHIIVRSNLSVLVDKTKSAGERELKTTHTTSDEPIIILDESKEGKEIAKDKDIEDTSSHNEELEQAKVKAKAEVASIKAKPSYSDINQLTELLVTDTLNTFSTMVDNASGATSINVPSAGQATALPAEEEMNTKDAGTNLKDKLIDLLGKHVVI
nr:retrovirus-related Pol polyprotein from transposon TNT 1-94 [Tanacetum cinerariifolium]